MIEDNTMAHFVTVARETDNHQSNHYTIQKFLKDGILVNSIRTQRYPNNTTRTRDTG